MGIYRQETEFTIRECKLTIFQKDKKYKTDFYSYNRSRSFRVVELL